MPLKACISGRLRGSTSGRLPGSGVTLIEMRASDPQVSGGGTRKLTGIAVPAEPRQQALLAAQALSLLAMTATVATRLWQDHIWFGFLLVGITVAVWAPEWKLRRERVLWFGYVAGVFIYTLLRAYADETAISTQTSYVIRLDEWLPGRSPVRFLQEQRLDRNFPDWVDYLAIAVHWSFFITPHAGAVWAFFYRRTAFMAYAAGLVITMWLGLLLFFLVPTTPPWLAAQQGEIEGVTRVMDSTIRETLGGDGGTFPGGAETYDEFYKALGEPNSVAAMPSIHMAVTFVMLLWVLRFARRYTWWLVAYCVAMAVSLVYLGEHYVADELAGVAVALIAWWLTLKFFVGRSFGDRRRQEFNSEPERLERRSKRATRGTG